LTRAEGSILLGPLEQKGGVVSSLVRTRWVFHSWLMVLGACSEREAGVSTPWMRAAARDGHSGEICGRPPLPNCPLQEWMEATLTPSLRTSRLDRLIKPLRALASAAPAQYSHWALRDGEIDSIVAFFGALAGDLPRAYIARPQLPATPRRAGPSTAPL
jgi:hypothetical protein